MKWNSVFIGKLLWPLQHTVELYIRSRKGKGDRKNLTDNCLLIFASYPNIFFRISGRKNDSSIILGLLTCLLSGRSLSRADTWLLTPQTKYQALLSPLMSEYRRSFPQWYIGRGLNLSLCHQLEIIQGDVSLRPPLSIMSSWCRI
jgi:hypothetical protein